jgi:hypothetical protein
VKKFLTIAAALAALILGTIASAQTQINQTNISSFPYNITQPGSYILTSNLTVTSANTSAIIINSSNVTVNLNGFTISGPLQCSASSCTSSWTSFGVEGSGNNITIHDGNINGFYAGASAWSGRIENLNVYSCQYGISATYATIRHNVAWNIASMGIYSSSGSVSENQVYNSNFAYQGYNTSFTNNTATNNSEGLYMSGGTASGNSLVSNPTDIYLGNNAVTTKTNYCTKGAC